MPFGYFRDINNSEKIVWIYKMKPRILVVEDDTISQKVFKYYLKGIYDVDIAGDPETAINYGLRNDYIAVLMDINLGTELNGIDITRYFRRQEKTKNLHIIACTAFTLDESKSDFMKKGFDDFLGKPFEKDQIVRLMADLSSKKAELSM
jgi:CheY-like chemotaxis protein